MGKRAVADKKEKEKEEEDVTPKAGFKVNDAYNLTLYMQKDSTTRGVLIVHMNLQFYFKKGKSKTGERLVWKEKEKKKYVKDYVAAVQDVWTEAFRLRTDSRVLQLRQIEVQFEFKTQIEGVWIFDHWELEVTKVEKLTTSSVAVGEGNVKLDSDDPYYTYKPKQRAAAHEFGHMMGLRDEYLNDDGEPEQNPHWTKDDTSIMSLGEVPRPRHYTPFAEWLTGQYKKLSELSGQKIVFYVDDGAGGKWTVNGGGGFKNAKL